MKDKSKDIKSEPDIEQPSKDEVRGRRNPKKKKRDYDKKYGDDNWN